MNVAIAGGHGKIALLLTQRLHARGTEIRSLIRDPRHADEVRARGGEPIVCDLERASVAQIGDAIRGAGGVVFAAGAGPGSGASRKLTMDRDGAVKLLEAATAVDVPRYLIISAVGAENPSTADGVFGVYLHAKAEADAAVRASDRQWTIVRPGGLTNEPGTGLVRVDTSAFRGRIPRGDVAGLLDAVLDDQRAIGQILYVNSGDQPIEQALDEVLG